MAALLQQKASVSGAKAAQPRASRVPVVVCRAQKVEEVATSRRATLGALAGAAALLSGAAPSFAAFGDSANVFGKITNKSGFVPYAGDSFAVQLPSKWNPSKENDFAPLGSGRTLELRYEDNFDVVNNVVILSQPTSNKSIEDFGDQAKFLESVSYLLGKQSFSGSTISEGGFAPDRVSAASLLDQAVDTDKKGKKFYKYEILTRTADGDEGGRHQLIAATVGGGKLYIIKVQVGDKRWIRGQDKEAKGLLNSFTVAA